MVSTQGTSVTEAERLLTIGSHVCRPDDFAALLLHIHGMNRHDIAYAQNCAVRTVHDRIARALHTITNADGCKRQDAGA